LLVEQSDARCEDDAESSELAELCSVAEEEEGLKKRQDGECRVCHVRHYAD
jgi:hypothetical protein